MTEKQQEGLTECLKRGIKVDDLAPHGYRQGCVYYRIHICQRDMRVKAVIEIKREAEDEDFQRMTVAAVFEIVDGKYHNVINSTLISKPVVLQRPANRVKVTSRPIYAIDGTIFVN